MSGTDPYVHLRAKLNASAGGATGANRLEPFPRFAPHDLEFWAGVSKLAARARERGEFDAAGDPIWSVNEWKAFCRGCRAYAHIPMFQSAVANTIHEVEAMLEDDFDAVSIHNVLRGFEAEREAKNRRRDPNAISYENVA